MISLIIITRNEEHDIEACLDSVSGLVNEIVLIDSGSTDRTLELARRFTANVSHRDWTGYSAQKQFALDKAKGPWVLNIDADERVSESLKTEIKNVLDKDVAQAAFRIPFHHYFLGKRLRFGGVAGETHIRLFRKDCAAYGTEPVHEGIKIQGSVGQLTHPIEHQSYRDLTEYLEKCNTYTSAIAEQKFRKGKRFHWWHHLRLPYEFAVRYFLKLGFLDGGAGLTYAVLSSYYVWLKFMKLRDLESKQGVR